jgi:hypothetical protein
MVANFHLCLRATFRELIRILFLGASSSMLPYPARSVAALMRRTQKLNWFRTACLSAAFLAVLVFAFGDGLWHHHDSSESEATCPICHLAHLTPQVAPPSLNLSTPIVSSWKSPLEPQAMHASPVAVSAPPRAPPA